MAKKSMYDDLAVAQVLDPQVYTSDQTSDEIDMQGFESLLLVGNVGITGDTLSSSVKLELEVQHSDTSGSGYAACADADIQDAVTGTNTGTFAVIDDAAEDEQAYKCAYVGTKRYVKVVANFTGTHSNGIELGVVALKGHAVHKPVA